MPQVIFADERTKPYGTEKCRRMRQHIFSELVPIAGDLAARYVKTAEHSSFEQANLELQDIYNQLRIEDLNLCGDSEELFEGAKRFAEKCHTARSRAQSPLEAYQACLRIVDHYQVKRPSVKGDNIEPALNRMCCSHWWNRRIQILKLRKIETIARNIELVNRLRGTYASDYTIHVKRKQKERNRLYLASNFVSNQNGEIFSLQNLAERSVSNPVVRRAELMVRIRGFEMVANYLGHKGEFYTLTTPSRMHACLHTGHANPRHDGTTTLEAHQYLTHLWALIRAELDRKDIRPYGFRVVEPHHDGTPHWHLLLFMPDKHREAVRKVMSHYALLDSGNEPGALKRRFKVEPIDPAKGSAVGYIAKYISKNIDGYALDCDSYGNDAIQAAERITAWANTWGIRQFQQIGGPSVTVWRQLRKLDKCDDPELEAIRQSATASDWAAFMLAMGDPETPHNRQAIKPFYDQSKQLNPMTGELYSPLAGRYGDTARLRVAGILWKGSSYSTQKHVWMLIKVDGEDVTLRSEAQAERTKCHAAAGFLGLKLQAIKHEIRIGTFDYFRHFPYSRKAKEFRKTRPDLYTIKEALINWLRRNQAKLQISTLQDYNSAIYHHLIPIFGDLTIAELTASKVKEWLSELPCSNKRKGNILTPLRQTFEELYHDEIIDKNPLQRVKNLPNKTREPEPFTQEEITKILSELTGQAKNLIQFAFYSGLRTSELIALRWQDVDFQNNRVFVRSAYVRGQLKDTKTKSGKREITLQPQAEEALLNQQAFTKQLNEIVFHDPHTNQRWRNDQPIRKRIWIPALRKAGINYRNPYQTRHTFASALLSRGENPLWVASQMGHEDWGMIIKVYGRWIPQSK